MTKNETIQMLEAKIEEMLARYSDLDCHEQDELMQAEDRLIDLVESR